MTTIVTRAGKGSVLSHAEMDANLNNLNNDKSETTHTHTGVYQAASANLDEYAAVNPTAAGLALLDDATASDQLTTLGVSTYMKGLLDDANDTTARNTLGLGTAATSNTGDFQAADTTLAAIADESMGAFSHRNKIINGGMQVYQRGGQTLSSTLTFFVDRWRGCIKSGTGITGTMARDAISGFTTGYAAILSGSWTAGQPAIEQNIEAANCKDLISKDITVSAKVRHDLGSNLNFYIKVSYANAEDNFSGTTNIGTSGAFSVSTGATTDISYTVNAGANAGNGLAVEIYTDSCTVVSKNVQFGAVQLEEGPVATPFEHRPIGTELALCQRYYETGGATTGYIFSSNVTPGGTYYKSTSFSVSKRTNPTIVLTNTASLNFPGTVGILGGISNTDFYEARVASGTGTGHFASSWTASAEL